MLPRKPLFFFTFHSERTIRESLVSNIVRFRICIIASSIAMYSTMKTAVIPYVVVKAKVTTQLIALWCQKLGLVISPHSHVLSNCYQT